MSQTHHSHDTHGDGLDSSRQRDLFGLRRLLRERPMAVLGVTLGVGALLGGILARRDRGMFLDLAHLATRLALARA